MIFAQHVAIDESRDTTGAILIFQILMQSAWSEVSMSTVGHIEAQNHAHVGGENEQNYNPLTPKHDEVSKGSLNHINTAASLSGLKFLVQNEVQHGHDKIDECKSLPESGNSEMFKCCALHRLHKESSKK